MEDPHCLPSIGKRLGSYSILASVFLMHSQMAIRSFLVFTMLLTFLTPPQHCLDGLPGALSRKKSRQGITFPTTFEHEGACAAMAGLQTSNSIIRDPNTRPIAADTKMKKREMIKITSLWN